MDEKVPEKMDEKVPEKMDEKVPEKMDEEVPENKTGYINLNEEDVQGLKEAFDLFDTEKTGFINPKYSFINM